MPRRTAQPESSIDCIGRAIVEARQWRLAVAALSPLARSTEIMVDAVWFDPACAIQTRSDSGRP